MYAGVPGGRSRAVLRTSCGFSSVACEKQPEGLGLSFILDLVIAV